MTNLLLTLTVCNVELVVLLVLILLFGGRLRLLWEQYRHPAVMAEAEADEAIQRLIRAHERVLATYQTTADPGRRAACRRAVEALRLAAECLASGRPEALTEANQALLACAEALA